MAQIIDSKTAQIIDSKNDSRSFFWGAENTSTTLTLLETAPGQFGISFVANWSGIYVGNTGGGPYFDYVTLNRLSALRFA